MAFLVEKENVKEGDRKDIARASFNRIKTNIPLQPDISVLYALGEHKELVTYKDTAIDSPYDLYTNTGHGSGPFGSPSEGTIKAILEPVENDYYYLVTDTSTGNACFAKTYEEHMKLV